MINLLFQALKNRYLDSVTSCIWNHEASHVNFPDVLPLKVNLINHLHRRTYTPRYKGDLVGRGIGFRAQKSKILYVVRPLRNKRFHILLSCGRRPRSSTLEDRRERRGGGKERKEKKKKEKIRGIISSPSSTDRKIPWVMSF